MQTIYRKHKMMLKLDFPILSSSSNAFCGFFFSSFSFFVTLTPINCQRSLYLWKKIVSTRSINICTHQLDKKAFIAIKKKKYSRTIQKFGNRNECFFFFFCSSMSWFCLSSLFVKWHLYWRLYIVTHQALYRYRSRVFFFLLLLFN